MARLPSKADEPVARLAAETSALLAEFRANELLYSWLSPAQREQWCCQGSFTVTGSGNRTVYWLSTAEIFNIVSDEGVAYCAVLPPGVALFKDLIADRLLAQKIALETDEKGFLAIATVRYPYTYNPSGPFESSEPCNPEPCP